MSEVPPPLPELVCPKPSSVALNPWGQRPMPWRSIKKFGKVVIFINPTYLEASYKFGFDTHRKRRGIVAFRSGSHF